MEVSARCKLSERAVASVINAYNVDNGINLEQNPEVVLTKSSVHSKRKRVMGEFSDAPLPPATVIYMDGKRFATSEKESFGEKSKRNVLKTNEHIIVADAQSGDYLGEFVPKSGSG